MEILSTILLALFLYFVFKIAYRVFMFYRQYKGVIDQIRNAHKAANRAEGYRSQHYASGENVTGNTAQKKKIIPDNEGEYVDFEDV